MHLFDAWHAKTLSRSVVKHLRVAIRQQDGSRVNMQLRQDVLQENVECE